MDDHMCHKALNGVRPSSGAGVSSNKSGLRIRKSKAAQRRAHFKACGNLATADLYCAPYVAKRFGVLRSRAALDLGMRTRCLAQYLPGRGTSEDRRILNSDYGRAARVHNKRPTILPLPLGEGRGEGNLLIDFAI